MIHLLLRHRRIVLPLVAALAVVAAGIAVPSSVVVTYPSSAPASPDLFTLRGGGSSSTSHGAYSATRRPGILEQFYWRLRGDATVSSKHPDAVPHSARTRSAVIGQFVGEYASDPTVALEGDGVVVEDVRRGSAAERAPLRPGDRIVAMNDQPVEDEEDLRRYTEEARNSDADLVRISLGTGLRLWLALEPRGASADFSGATVRTASPRVNGGHFEVLPLSAYRGGQSGLLTAMVVYQQMEELTGVPEFAACGDVDPDGYVPDVGPSIRQRVIAARNAGLATVLVPEGDERQALRAADDKIDVVAVRTFDDVVEWMHDDT